MVKCHWGRRDVGKGLAALSSLDCLKRVLFESAPFNYQGPLIGHGNYWEKKKTQK